MSKSNWKYRLSGRGSLTNPSNKFEEFSYEPLPGEEEGSPNTQYIPVYPKKLVNAVDSPDIGMAYSMNPYQGCEHGCIYCYARNSHEFWGYGAGQDFEAKILVKKNAPQLLKNLFRKPSWKAQPIVISGNTDCYQPGERQFQITRELLRVMADYKHPCSIITKNALIQRDLDILAELGKNNLIKVAISLTTLDEDLRRTMEPRTASVKNRLNTIRRLSDNNIPVTVMLAPIIPGLNDQEIPKLLKETSENGAIDAGYTVVRLNGQIGDIFSDWIKKQHPNKADKVLNQIAACHDGTLNDSRWGKRIKGEGEMATIVEQLFTLNKKKYFAHKPSFHHNLELFRGHQGMQKKLF